MIFLDGLHPSLRDVALSGLGYFGICNGFSICADYFLSPERAVYLSTG